MNWKSIPYWRKGLIIGIISALILVGIPYFFVTLSKDISSIVFMGIIFITAFPAGILIKPFLSTEIQKSYVPLATILLVGSVILYTLIGGIIGFIIQKIKKK